MYSVHVYIFIVVPIHFRCCAWCCSLVWHVWFEAIHTNYCYWSRFVFNLLSVAVCPYFEHPISIAILPPFLTHSINLSFYIASPYPISAPTGQGGVASQTPMYCLNAWYCIYQAIPLTFESFSEHSVSCRLAGWGAYPFILYTIFCQPFFKHLKVFLFLQVP